MGQLQHWVSIWLQRAGEEVANVEPAVGQCKDTSRSGLRGAEGPGQDLPQLPHTRSRKAV